MVTTDFLIARNRLTVSQLLQYATINHKPTIRDAEFIFVSDILIGHLNPSTTAPASPYRSSLADTLKLVGASLPSSTHLDRDWRGDGIIPAPQTVESIAVMVMEITGSVSWSKTTPARNRNCPAANSNRSSETV